MLAVSRKKSKGYRGRLGVAKIVEDASKKERDEDNGKEAGEGLNALLGSW